MTVAEETLHAISTPDRVESRLGALDFDDGKAPLGAPCAVPETRFVEVSGKLFNTIYPNDFSYWELAHELVQEEPSGAGDPELMGLLSSVGIAHGKPFRARRPHAQDR